MTFASFQPPQTRGRETRSTPLLSSPVVTGEVSSEPRAASEEDGGGMRAGERKSRSFAKGLRRRMTDAEVILWSRLRRKPRDGLQFRRQHPIGPYIADFACVAMWLVIEVDGDTHSTEDEIAHDMKRDAFMRERGWRVFRITNHDVYKNLDGVLEGIYRALPLPPADPRVARIGLPRNNGGGKKKL
jgi:very-short-patch-repair endonuclease